MTTWLHSSLTAVTPQRSDREASGLHAAGRTGNEMLNLMKDCVRFHSEQCGDGKICGKLIIKSGLERRARKRKLVIDHEMKHVFERLVEDSPVRLCFHKPPRSDKASGALGLPSAPSASLKSEHSSSVRSHRLGCRHQARGTTIAQWIAAAHHGTLEAQSL
jgi:hypothetical protein